MKSTTNRHRIASCAALAVMAAWVPSAIAATAEERAECAKMAKEMGTEQRHEHSQDKGQGPSAMNMKHARCKEILAEPVKNGNKGSPHDHQ